MVTDPKRWTIAVDVMGADTSSTDLAEAIAQEAQRLSADESLSLLATESTLAKISPHPQLTCVPVTEVVTMDDAPLIAVRKKKNSSMQVGLDLVAAGKVDGFVSAGNTGALIASARFTLPLLPTIQRPALFVRLPTVDGEVAMLDVGGNISADSTQLLELARLGRAYLYAEGKSPVRIGLLNIGQEEQKGSEGLREAYKALKENLPGSFVGNVEGRAIFQGKVDLVVTDGFTGNVFLKSAEGITAFLLDLLHEGLSGPNLQRLGRYLNEPAGAFLAGLDGIVIKCHGASTSKALVSAVRSALSMARSGLVARMRDYL